MKKNSFPGIKQCNINDLQVDIEIDSPERLKAETLSAYSYQY